MADDTDPEPGPTADAGTDPAATVNISDAPGTVGVYVPYRKIEVTLPDGTAIPFDGLDVDISITHKTSGPPQWSATVYDLANYTWENLQRGSEVKLTLGWKNGPTRRVVRGPIQLMRPQPWRGTTRYLMRGTSHDGARLGKRLSRTWRTTAPHTIARDIASIANLDVGVIVPETDRLDTNWTITKSRPLSQWLDELTQDAARQTDTEWTWYVHDGDLYFVPRGTPTGDRVTLAHRSEYSQYPSRSGFDSPRDPAIHSRKFDRQLDPMVRRGRAVAAVPPGSDRDEANTLVVGSYQFESSSRTGRHFMHGSLVPQRAQFTPPFNPQVGASDATDVAPEEPDHD